MQQPNQEAHSGGKTKRGIFFKFDEYTQEINRMATQDKPTINNKKGKKQMKRHKNEPDSVETAKDERT